MISFKQYIAEAVNLYDAALTKRELLMLRDNIASKLHIEQKRVTYQQAISNSQGYTVIYFVADIGQLGIDTDDAWFRARLLAKDAEHRLKKMLAGKGDGLSISTIGKVIEPRQGRSIKIKHPVKLV